jgi:undecaprenyl-diphosphatase
MTLIQTLLIAVIQGITELFPISSVAHAVLTPKLFGWDLDPQFMKEHFLPFVVMLHLGTALALLVYFGRDWTEFARAVVDRRANVARRELLLVAVGTVPAALIGLVFESKLRALFPSALSAGVFLIVNGVILFAGERFKRRGRRRLENLGIGQALLIGLAQSLALIPGFSRSGASIVAGFWAGLDHEASARFSMLLATPIIAGASIIELPKLLHAPPGTLSMALIGGVVAGIVAFISVSALMAWFRRHEVGAMWPFALYCWVAGACAITFL